jgi:dTDP-4-amino-4,6-dideoxygalactose transaminase
MRGRVPDIDRVLEVCERRGITLIEDAAHSLGVLWRGRQTGTFGLAGAFSTQSNKIVDSGEGGILVTDSEEVAFEAMLYAGCYEANWQKHFGTAGRAARLREMVNAYPAYNFRMSNLSAAALLPQIDEVEARVAAFGAIFDRLAATLARSNRVRIPRFTEGARPAPDSLQCELLDMTPGQLAAIRADLREQGIKIEIFTGENARSFWNWRFVPQSDGACPRTRDLLSRTIDMRLRIDLDTSEIDRIGGAILAAVARHA